MTHDLEPTTILSHAKDCDALIVGGGIIGVSTAYFLSLQGKKVIVLDKAKIGEACSFQNAGWMTPCFAMPLPMPGMLLKSFKWLLNPNSPLYIKPSLNPDLISWLTRFLLSMSKKKSLKAIEALVTLSQRSLDLYSELIPGFPSPTNYTQNGLLMVATTSAGLKDIYTELELGQKFGVTGKKLSATECLTKEPLLKENIIGGVHFTREAHAEPYETVLFLKKLCEQQGVTFLEQTELLDWETEGAFVHQCVASDLQGIRNIRARQVLLATGSWSLRLGKKLGLTLPIFGGKGYSLHSEDLESPLSLPIMYLEKKIALTPRQKGFRLAGTLELVNEDFSITARRVNNIIEGTRSILKTREEFRTTPAWAGLRPCSPDGVPLMGQYSKYNNVYISTGHQMLGFQSGIGSGEFLAKVMNEEPTPNLYQIFRPDRF